MIKNTLKRVNVTFEKLPKWVYLSLFSSILIVGLTFTHFFHAIDTFFEGVVTQAVQTKSSGKTVVVGIDDETVQALGGYPFERKKLAKVLNSLNSQGVNKIYLDMSLNYEGSNENDRALLNAFKALGSQRLALPVSTIVKLDSDNKPYVKTIMVAKPFLAHATNVSADLSYRKNSHKIDAVGKNSVGALVAYPTLADWFYYGEKAVPRILKIDYGIQAKSVPVVSFLDILQGKNVPQTIAGKNIIIGVTASQVLRPLEGLHNNTLYRPLMIALSAETRNLGQDIVSLSAITVFLFAIGLVFFLGYVLQRYNALLGALIALTFCYSFIVLAIYVREHWLINFPLRDVFVGSFLMYVGTQLMLHPRFSRLRRAYQVLLEKIDLTYLKLLHSGKDAIVTFTQSGEVLTMNNSAEALFKIKAEECIGQSIEAILPKHSKALLENVFAQLPGRLQANVGCEGARPKHLEMSYNAMPAENDWVGLVSIRDITELKQREEKLLYAATHDELTGLANRAGFENQIKEVTALALGAQKKPLAVLMIDLDKFKQVNDTLGHHVGDGVLKMVADRLRTTLRQSDFVARLGGDEFAVIMSGFHQESDAEILADKLVKVLSEPIFYDGEVAHIGASIGIAFSNKENDNIMTLMQHADEAMYCVKKGGRNGFFVAQPQEA